MSIYEVVQAYVQVIIVSGRAKLFTEMSYCFILCMIAFVENIINSRRQMATLAKITVFLLNVADQRNAITNITGFLIPVLFKKKKNNS